MASPGWAGPRAGPGSTAVAECSDRFVTLEVTRPRFLVMANSEKSLTVSPPPGVHSPLRTGVDPPPSSWVTCRTSSRWRRRRWCYGSVGPPHTCCASGGFIPAGGPAGGAGRPAAAGAAGRAGTSDSHGLGRGMTDHPNARRRCSRSTPQHPPVSPHATPLLLTSPLHTFHSTSLPSQHSHPVRPPPSPSHRLQAPQQTPLHRGCSGWASPVGVSV